MESTFERRMLEIASDILLAVSRGELAPDSAVVGAAAHAIARLRPEAAGAGAIGAGSPGGAGQRVDIGVPGGAAASAGGHPGSAEGRGVGSAPPVARAAELAVRPVGRAPRLVPPIEHVLAVAELMRAGRLPFAAACARRGEESGVSAQAVRNACCRWLDLSAHDWQPLCAAGSDEAALPVARRLAARQGWARERIAQAFRLDPARLD
jgi:hypothetical protein